MSIYSHPQWQRRRLEIMQRDHFTCRRCGDDQNTLNVHHRRYRVDRRIWEYDDDDLVTLCRRCHEAVHTPSAPTPLAAHLPESRHGYRHFVDGLWLCFCGCGSTLAPAQFRIDMSR